MASGRGRKVVSFNKDIVVLPFDSVKAGRYHTLSAFTIDRGVPAGAAPAAGGRDGSVQISVKDTGPGIPRDILPRIFEPYFTTKEKGDGAGLGLAAVHGIVTDHNGEIKVYSENGRGAVFHLLFPLLSITPPEPRASRLEAIPGGSERILIIDDEPNVQAVTKLVLERLGYIVETYSNPFDALDRLIKDKHAFDLVITDKSMPEMTGFDLARLVSEIRTDLPVALCTGFLEKSDTARADALGIKEVILKPITVAALGNAVRRALRHRPA